MTELRVQGHPGTFVRKCPKCGHQQGVTRVCESCGIVFEKYLRQLEGASADPPTQRPAYQPPTPKDLTVGADTSWRILKWGALGVVLLLAFHTTFTWVRDRLQGHSEEIAAASLQMTDAWQGYRGESAPSAQPAVLPAEVERIVARSAEMDSLDADSPYVAVLQRKTEQLFGEIELVQRHLPSRQARGKPLDGELAEREGLMQRRIIELRSAHDLARRNLGEAQWAVRVSEREAQQAERAAQREAAYGHGDDCDDC